jgi:hypothetical protein
MGVEQPQLLAAMNRVERVVDVERDPFGNLVARTRNKDRPWRGPCAARPMRSNAHAQQGPGVGQILQPRDRGLRTQFAIGRRQIERHLEHGIAAQRTGVVSVFISRRDHQQAKAEDVGKAMCDRLGRARVHMQAASRSATRRRCSTSRNTRPPPSDESKPPSNWATTALPETGDRPGGGSIGSVMAGVVS